MFGGIAVGVAQMVKPSTAARGLPRERSSRRRILRAKRIR